MKSLNNKKVALIFLTLGTILTSCKNQNPKIDLGNKISIELIQIPDQNFCITKTEITQDFYQAVTGENPSTIKGNKFPVESVSWYDSIVFCNKLSIQQSKTPCYKVNGSTNPSDWNYTPHTHKSIEGTIEFDPAADGYRIPTMEEWDIAIKGGENFTYSGSEDVDTVAWTDCNSGETLHEVAQLKPNSYGVYDMSGNVFEWVWFIREDSSRYYRGGSYFDSIRDAKCTAKKLNYASGQFKTVGFRITCNKQITEKK